MHAGREARGGTGRAGGVEENTFCLWGGWLCVAVLAEDLWRPCFSFFVFFPFVFLSRLRDQLGFAANGCYTPHPSLSADC